MGEVKVIITVEDFLQRNPPNKRGGKVSILAPWHTALVALRNKGASNQLIVDYLAENGVEVKRAAVASYVLKYIGRRERKQLNTP